MYLIIRSFSLVSSFIYNAFDGYIHFMAIYKWLFTTFDDPRYDDGVWCNLQRGDVDLNTICETL